MQVIDNAISAIEGRTDAIEALGMLRLHLDELKALESELTAIAMDEWEKGGVNPGEHKGWKVEQREGRRTYNFKHIPQWAELRGQMEEVEAKAKLANQMYERGVKPVDEDTGEVLPLPEVKYSKPSLIIKPQTNEHNK